jgi:hypothetical protein
VNGECCRPPLEEWELRLVIHNALTQPDRPFSASRMIEVS